MCWRFIQANWFSSVARRFQAGNSRKSLSVDLVVASVGVAVAVFECWRRNRSSSAVSPPVGDLPPLRRAALYEAQRICINVRYEYLWIVSRRLSPSFLQEWSLFTCKGCSNQGEACVICRPVVKYPAQLIHAISNKNKGPPLISARLQYSTLLLSYGTTWHQIRFYFKPSHTSQSQ